MTPDDPSSERTTPSVDRDQADARGGGGRRVLACASSGGHFKQLVSLVGRIPDVGELTWVTYDRGLSTDVLVAAGREADQLVHAPYAAPRDIRNLSKDALVIGRLLLADDYDLAISTGAGIAVAALPLARAMGVRACFIESATRFDGPSLSGRILQRIPGIELYTQGVSASPGSFTSRWHPIGSVHDEFAVGDDRDVPAIRRVVVTVGTIQPYGFRRLIDRLLSILPPDVEVLWQTGATDVSDLPIEARETVPGPELEAAIADADVVVAHAGTGTAVTVFEHGRCPVLVPRRRAFDEHIDDHQVATAVSLAQRGLSIHAEVAQLSLPLLATAAGRSIVRRVDVPALAL